MEWALATWRGRRLPGGTHKIQGIGAGFIPEVPPGARPAITRYAVITAFAVGVGLLIVGRGVFYALGIEVSDLLVAGGLILFAISASRLVVTAPREELGPADEFVGLVPIRTPILVGPVTLASLCAAHWSVLVSRSRAGLHPESHGGVGDTPAG